MSFARVIQKLKKFAKDVKAQATSIIELSISIIVMVIAVTIGLAVKDQIVSQVNLTSDSSAVISSFNNAIKMLPLMALAVIGFAIIYLFIGRRGE